ncbi:polysaccharide biosynthesis C-terminal domain-containing protein, partial [Patescibacteria group bacterium]|nr:polysaccharide biosynthesis C-terminal domain-containing protein [Patescibacteria group bacterium]
RTMGLAVGQLNFLVITILASTLTVGSLTIFNLANNLQYFPIGIIGFSFAVAAFPTLSKFVAERKQDELINHLSKTIRQILFFIIPATLVFLLLRAQIVRIVLGSGQFDWDATIATGNTLAFFALSLTAQCMIPLLARGFYALHDTWVPFKIAFVSVLINIIFSLLLKDLLGVSGLALAFSIAATFQATALWITLRKKIGTLRELDILQTVFKISFAAIVMGIVTQLVKTKLGSSMDLTSFWKVATQGFVAGALGLITYIGICFVLKVEELFELIGSFKRKWLKLTNIPVEISEVDDV